MYYCGGLTTFVGSNSAIIGKRESGKTTILKNMITHCYQHDYTIILFDSVTDHVEQSLLLDTKKRYKDSIVIPSPSKEEIKFTNIKNTSFPFCLVDKTDRRIYSFNVTKYLEEGYETNDLQNRYTLHQYYKQLIIQELTVMLPIVAKKKCIVIMDEIEFTTQMHDIVKKYNSFDIQFVVTQQHSENIPNSLFDVLLIL